ncbi:hypothetical protein PVAP13_5NG369581 [Panicum virgatum]|uniref:Uncharacterized protein n=1 Tax=Panicum virgatum TaxID=38727 RepID=A0A8T0RR44_PANVG|nr:hypothetical protein PVAP13_5NG369581 [Panicum virgatum]
MLFPIVQHKTNMKNQQILCSCLMSLLVFVWFCLMTLVPVCTSLMSLFRKKNHQSACSWIDDFLVADNSFVQQMLMTCDN